MLLIPPTISFAVGETEPNNTKENADILLNSIPINGQLMSENDRDWFSITATGAGTINIEFNTSFFITYVVEDSEGNMLASFSSLQNSEVGINAAGTYYIYTSVGIRHIDSPYILTATLTN